jgi:hypothetical protein
MVQRLDYQGLPFRCSFVEGLGISDMIVLHGMGLGDVDDSMDTQVNDLYMSEGDVEEVGTFTSVSEADSSGTLSDSYLGKLKLYCPSLFFKLSSWEKDFLEKTFPSSLFSLPETTSLPRVLWIWEG